MEKEELYQKWDQRREKAGYGRGMGWKEGYTKDIRWDVVMERMRREEIVRKELSEGEVNGKGRGEGQTSENGWSEIWKSVGMVNGEREVGREWDVGMRRDSKSNRVEGKGMGMK